MYCWYFYYKNIFLYFHSVLFMFGDSLFAHRWNPNRCYHLRSGWIQEQQQLRGGSMLFKTSSLLNRGPAVGCTRGES